MSIDALTIAYMEKIGNHKIKYDITKQNDP